MEEELRFIDDKLFVYTPLPQYGDGIHKTQLVMTKEIFQECYKRWIEPQIVKCFVTEMNAASKIINKDRDKTKIEGYGELLIPIHVFDEIRDKIDKMDYLTIEGRPDGYNHYIDKYDVLKIIMDKCRAEKRRADARNNH